MRLKLNESKLGYYPELLNYLSSLQLDKIDYKHPNDTLKQSFTEIIVLYSKMLPILNKHEIVDFDSELKREKDIKELLRLTKQLYQEADIYIENMKKMINSIKLKEDAVMKDVQKELADKIKPYEKNIISIPNNAIKHDGNIIKSIEMIKDESTRIIGYYLEASREETYGPNPNVHKDYKGEATAFSYNKSLKMILGSIYSISNECLVILKKYVNDTICENKDLTLDFNTKAIINTLIEIPLAFFPDELNKRFVNIYFEGDVSIIEYPSSLFPLRGSKYEIQSSVRISKTSTKFTLPYFRERK